MPAALLLLVAGASAVGADPLPVRGLHMSGPSRAEMPAIIDFVRTALAREGVNVLIVEFGWRFDYRSRAEFANAGAPGKDDVRKLAQACREAGIQLIPQINCLGHQSWAAVNGALLAKHPELDETPGKFPENKGIYCRSYCPLHPEVHKILFDLMDELGDACEAKAFHVGMDEVFILADADCPRCAGKGPADLFAAEATLLRDHLRERGRRMWMWGDRLLDGKATRIGEWEASTNETAAAIDKIPKDIVICDWHYEKAHDTPRHFAAKGFDVVVCPWRKEDVALKQLALIQALRAEKDVGPHALGMVQTTWCGPASFIRAHGGDKASRGSTLEAAACFRALCARMREGQRDRP